MSTSIHPTAVVESGAELGADVVIGPFAYVGPSVRLGDRGRLHHHASIEGRTEVGADCEVFPYACLGGKTQDLKYTGGSPGVRIGSCNVFREYCTVHAATNDNDFTIIGDDNTLLAYTHIAHDCVLGSHIVMSNAISVAGHVHIEDHVTVGGMAGIHQFCRIGAYAMISAYAKVVQDIAPFFIADGQPAIIRAVNKVGLERKGYSREQIERVKTLHRVLFREGLNRSQALERIAEHAEASSEEFQRLLAFARASDRGLAPGSV